MIRIRVYLHNGDLNEPTRPTDRKEDRNMLMLLECVCTRNISILFYHVSSSNRTIGQRRRREFFMGGEGFLVVNQ